MAYDAYTQFITAARKFPRWTNVRRRPVESNGGKILRSIIEEIAQVEDAILDYKKDFFVVNYIGREDEIIDYLYGAHVGTIEDLSAFQCMDPIFLVTDDKELFYQNKEYAYYENGYLILWDTNDENRLTYSYHGYTYYAEITESHIWNVIDEFAWWCGLERFEKERNASLLQRCLYQLHYDADNPAQNRRPNSTEKGLKNAIRNAASVLGNISEEEIKFLTPDENVMAYKNDEGITLYEEISRFNRDIARTRQWDIDYWDNAFRKLYYLPHVWDAEVDSYKNGVGYMDSLYIATAKDVNAESNTDVDIKGYKKSAARIEQYIQSNNVTKPIALELVRYADTINPLSVQFRIQAEDIIKVEDTDQIWFDFYKHYVGRHVYKLEDFVLSYEDGIELQNRRALDKNANYKLVFKSSDDGVSRMEIASCTLSGQNILQEDEKFVFRKGILTEKSVWLHATITDNLELPDNLETYRDGGIVLTEPLLNGYFEIPLGDFLQIRSQNFIMPVSGGFQTVTFLPQYVTAEKYTHTVDGTGWEVADDDIDMSDVLTIHSTYCRNFQFDVDKFEADAYASITVYIDGVKDDTRSTRKYMNNGIPYTLNLKECHDVRIVIKRLSAKGFTVRNIRIAAYQIECKLYNGHTIVDEFILKNKEKILSRQPNGTCRLVCTIKNYMSISPLIDYVHVGSQTINKTYELTFSTEGQEAPELQIETNCKIELYKDDVLINANYDTHNTYVNNSEGKKALYLDLSRFSRVYAAVPTVKKYQDSVYTILLAPGEERTDITIDGDGYANTARETLKEALEITDQEVYLARGLKGFIIHGGGHDMIKSLSYEDMTQGDRIVINTSLSDKIRGCFVVNNTDFFADMYTGGFTSFYIYPDNATHYVAYNTQNIVQEETEFSLIDSFVPDRKKNGLLLYRIDAVLPDTGVTVLFKHDDELRDWSIRFTEPVVIRVPAYGTINQDIITTSTVLASPSVRLSNAIQLNDIQDSAGAILDLGLYDVKVPDTMYVEYTEGQTYRQTEYTDGGTMYIEEDGFNKLRHAHIANITRVTLDDGETLPVSAYTLLSDAGILVWNFAQDSAYWGRGIKEIVYIYRKPFMLHYKSIEDLYDLVGYKIDTMECVNTDSYIIPDAIDQAVYEIDYNYFSEMPDKISAVCTNPCYIAEVQNNQIVVSQIADDDHPVIHNGYYYLDGREYWYYAHKQESNEKRVDGVDIENGDITHNVLTLQREAVNYLENSRMECNRMAVHCIVDFMYPRNDANQEPLRHIGACEAFSAWNDYAVSRALTVYKNGYATLFSMRDNGYALLDITDEIHDHTTISCLYSGHLKFALAREIRILNEQALKTVFCEKVQEFSTYADIAYCINTELDTDTYRYYLTVEGSGVLDEVLIHDATEIKDIQAWHVKGIDKLGLITEEMETAEKTVDVEYSSDFMSYANLETDRDGYLRPGTTIDWNITKLADIDLSTVLTNYFLRRNDTLIAQSDRAVLVTKPIEIKYRRSIKELAVKINTLIEQNFKGFSITVSAASVVNGTYTPLRHIDHGNQINFQIAPQHRFLKIEVAAKENKIIQNIVLFASYKESTEEDLSVFYHTQGSAVTKIFDIGAKGDYRFQNVLAEEGSSWDAIYIRGAKESANKELIWTTWQNTAAFPDFTGCQLFQFKIIMKSKTQYAKINGFRFEVLKHV